MTLFEKILARQIPATIVYEDDDCFAIRDIHPQAPTHVLVIPRKPLPTITAATEEDEALLGRCLLACARVAKQEGLSSWRLVQNNGDDAGQSVDHVHFHVIGGRRMGWPPG